MARHTTIRMHPDIEREAKAYAHKTQRTFTQLVEDAIQHLMRTETRRPRKKIVLPVAGDPTKPITEEQYKRAIQQMYDEEAVQVLRMGREEE
jgi:hypothetical protein